MNRKNALVEPVVALSHPAEDLSADDDLLSWMLIDQLGALPNTKLGVHPQQVKFVGPTFKTEEVSDIIRDTVIKGNVNNAMQALQEFHLINSHLKAKTTDGQRDRFIQHLRRYLLPLTPTSRVEIYTTSRYTAVTGHTELAVFATRPLAPGIVLTELQGSVVPLPDAWREEMEIGEDFAYRAAEEVEDEEYDSEDSDEDDASSSRDRERGKGKEKEGETKRQGARRSDRTKRRDFSIVWSGLKRCFQLFLGPARFLNHDCKPNVELLRQGKYVTFRVLHPIKIGEELTTFYGDNYFGKGNIECLCLTCEQNNQGGFTPKPELFSASSSRSRSRDTSAAPASISNRVPRPSALRNVFKDDLRRDESPSSSKHDSPGPSRSVSDQHDHSHDHDHEHEHDHDREEHSTPHKIRPAKTFVINDSESIASESEMEIESPRRNRSQRLAAKKVKPWAYLKGPKEVLRAMQQGGGDYDKADTEDEELPEDFPRCATCAKPLHERVWYANRYFDHCQRCVRHALVFQLPWPAHRLQDVLEYPPSHLIPNGYMPRKISQIPLPTLSKKKREAEEAPPPSPQPMTKEQRSALRLRQVIELQEYIVESLRNEAWTAQDAAEQAEQALIEAAEAAQKRKEEIKRKKLEEKRKREENTIKGSGVWQRYEYVTEEELRKKEAERMAVTSGTRRGGKFRAENQDEEMIRLAALKREKERLEEEKIEAREREYRRQRDIRRGRPHPSTTVHIDEGIEGSGVAVPAQPEGSGQDNWNSSGPSGIHHEDVDSLEVRRLVKPITNHNTPPPVSRAGPSTSTSVSNGVPGAVNNTPDSSTSSRRRRGRPPGTGKHQRQRAKEALSRQQAQDEGRDRHAYNLPPYADAPRTTGPQPDDPHITRMISHRQNGSISKTIPKDVEVISIHDTDSMRSRSASFSAPGDTKGKSRETASELPSVDAASEEAKDSDGTAASGSVYSSPGHHLPTTAGTEKFEVERVIEKRRIREERDEEQGDMVSVEEDEIVVAVEEVEVDRTKKRKRLSDETELASGIKRKRTFFAPRVSLPVLVPTQQNAPRPKIYLP